MDKLAANIQVGPAGGGFSGFGQLGLENLGGGASSAFIFGKAISTAIGIITIVAIIWFVIQLMIGAVGIMMSGGDKGKAEQARAKITSSLTGLVVVIAGIFIVGLVGTIFGFTNILDIGGMIINLGQ